MDDKVWANVLIMDISQRTFRPHFGFTIFLGGDVCLNLFIVERDLIVKGNGRFGALFALFIVDLACLIVMGKYFGGSFHIWGILHD